MARELSRNPRLILVAQPTRGVDVGSIEQIHTEILRRRDQGAGVLVVSSQLDELMALSDRIVVMFQGRIAATLTRGEFNEGRIGVAMGGAQARLQS
jgi:simple sugar transport system ATP-binding protein